MSQKDTVLTIGKQFDFSTRPFTPARFAARLGLVRFTGAVYRKPNRSPRGQAVSPVKKDMIEMVPPGKIQLTKVAEACLSEKIWKNLGFKRPLPGHLFHRRFMPNGGGGFEPVEILLVRRAAGAASATDPFGLFILYDFPNPRPNAVEIDFAVIDPQEEGRFSLLSLKTLVDCYLCGVRGAKHVCWKRNKRTRRYWSQWTDLKPKLEKFEKEDTPVPRAHLRG